MAKKTQKKLDDKIKKSIKTMDIILIIVGIMLTTFTITMIWVHVTTGSIPDTLCTCVFATLGTECGVMGWIKTNKNKYYARELNKENGKPTDSNSNDLDDESVENNFNSEEENSDDE